jgi:hypothetical protein
MLQAASPGPGARRQLQLPQYRNEHLLISYPRAEEHTPRDESGKRINQDIAMYRYEWFAIG